MPDGHRHAVLYTLQGSLWVQAEARLELSLQPGPASFSPLLPTGPHLTQLLGHQPTLDPCVAQPHPHGCPPGYQVLPWEGPSVKGPSFQALGKMGVGTLRSFTPKLLL